MLLAGVIDYPNLILGLTFIGCAILTAHDSPQVLSGLLVGFMGVINLLMISNVFPIDTSWWLTAIFAVGVAVFELTSLRPGPASSQAKYAIIIPMSSLFFMFILAIANFNPVLYVDWQTQPLKALEYLLLMFLTGFLTIQYLGWKVLKKNQGKWIAVLAGACVLISFAGAYTQGTLAW